MPLPAEGGSIDAYSWCYESKGQWLIVVSLEVKVTPLFSWQIADASCKARDRGRVQQEAIPHRSL